MTGIPGRGVLTRGGQETNLGPDLKHFPTAVIFGFDFQNNIRSLSKN